MGRGELRALELQRVGYPLLESAYWNTDFAPRYNRRCLIYAEACHDLALTGRGAIDCRGLDFCEKLPEAGFWQYRRKTNTELLEKINAGLEAVISEGLLDDLTQKWLVGEG